MGLNGPGEGAALATPSLGFDSFLYHLPQSDLSFPFLEALLISPASTRLFPLYMRWCLSWMDKRLPCCAHLPFPPVPFFLLPSSFLEAWVGTRTQGELITWTTWDGFHCSGCSKTAYFQESWKPQELPVVPRLPHCPTALDSESAVWTERPEELLVFPSSSSALALPTLAHFANKHKGERASDFLSDV